MPLVIRPRTATDHDALVEQFHGLNLHEEPFARNRRTDRLGGLDSLAAAQKDVDETGGVALVAELDGRVVGHLFLLIAEDAIYVREELRTYAYVSDLFVREEVRGLGVGKALMAEAERFARERGLRRLMIGVLSGNARAEQLYTRLGFAPHAIELTKPIGEA
jgi:GNAT superfamily N-acetyltransferase